MTTDLEKIIQQVEKDFPNGDQSTNSRTGILAQLKKGRGKYIQIFW